MPTTAESKITHYTVPEFLGHPVPRDGEKLSTVIDGFDWFELKENELSLVLNREVWKSVRASAELAVCTARKFPDKKVMLCNTYAGAKLLHDSIEAALRSQSIEGLDVPGEQELLHNMVIVDFPMDTMSVEHLKEEVTAAQPDVVLINAFEFCRISSRHRQKLAYGIIELQRERRIALTVFSTDVRKDLAPGVGGRGSICLLSSFAGTVAIWGPPVRVHPDREGLLRVLREAAMFPEENKSPQTDSKTTNPDGVHEVQMFPHADDQLSRTEAGDELRKRIFELWRRKGALGKYSRGKPCYRARRGGRSNLGLHTVIASGCCGARRGGRSSSGEAISVLNDRRLLRLSFSERETRNDNQIVIASEAKQSHALHSA